MKTRTTGSLLIVMTLALVGCVTPTVVLQEAEPVPAASSPAESVTARVDQLFAQWDRSDSPGCILGVSQNGVVVYERGYGMANLDYGLSITTASVFDVGSIDKQFTAMAILILEQRGQKTCQGQFLDLSNS
ncbi:MAG TPA: serine hydrolase domain-containing protein [Rhodothermales bacterium]|nr:serine hydrolase domain-containing protein [Rhodothermales bacterium]